ncbi:MAG TPA: antibiotic biosynthesis monooxygenase [bacterium]|nr:antibiotic biosynthesis monooxygenase [bacterium]
MIARIWRGQSDLEHADSYFQHLTKIVFPSLTRLPGHLGAYALRRQAGDAIEFLAVTLWDSLDAVRQFAGEQVDVAVVEPEAQAVLTGYDPFVRHFEVAYPTNCQG